MRVSVAGVIERWAPRPLRARLAGPAAWADGALLGADDRAVARRIALATFLVRIASAVIAYLSQVLLARWMGDFEYGVYVVVWVGAVIIGGLSCLGIQTALVRFIPEYAARGAFDLLRGVMLGSRLHGIVTATIVAAAGVAGVALFRAEIAHYYLMPLYLAAICIPMLAIGEIQDGLARGFNWADLALWPTFIIRPLLIIVLTYAAIRLGGAPDAVTAMIAAIVATWLVALGQMVAISRRVRRTVPAGPRRTQSLHWIAVALPIFLVEGFFNLLTNVDILIVGQLRPPEEVAVYFAAVKTLALVHFVYFAVRAALMPRFSQYYASGEHDRFEASVRDSLHWTFWPSVAAVLLLFVFGRLLLAMFGPSFVGGYSLLFIFAIGLLFRASIGPAESILTMAGEQRICAAVYAGTFLVNLVLNYSLIPRFGLEGAAIATTTALIVETVAVYWAVRWRLRLRCSILHIFSGSLRILPRADAA
ncbi:oligosaccharide flippase family protein [Kaistia dalseonensis]|uniref:O-antigen/teichoic acid export membrane protein n=1 Tax=Kaistia dalseonensis TaxID=410840 RepID=A0ABU0H4C0_9HYPH|nr:MATE family efflux transporter [Kaistia dalseonensis]MCX5494566.1 oligosaccharide flippase family protein [Kaistia dalseonensis]MDQ0437146.1 O-antigen/teichoic acid export membrane protein [Kaistia dalseonensis]